MLDVPQTIDAPARRTLQSASHELGTISLADRSLTGVLQEVCRLALAVLPDVDAASVTLVEDDGTRTAVFTSDLAVTLDERQYRPGFGPCLDAARHGRVVRIDDTAHDAAYFEYAALARRQDVTSVLALGLTMPGHVRGGLALYRLRSDAAFDAATEEVAVAYAGRAAVVLANAAFVGSTTRLVTRTQSAMASRAVIDQAKGIVMLTTACDADEAFRVLTQMSQHANRKLRDLATDITTAAARGQRQPLLVQAASPGG